MPVIINQVFLPVQLFSFHKPPYPIDVFFSQLLVELIFPRVMTLVFLPEVLMAYVRVPRCRFEAPVSEELLDVAEPRAVFKQMCRERVADAVQAESFPFDSHIREILLKQVIEKVFTELAVFPFKNNPAKDMIFDIPSWPVAVGEVYYSMCGVKSLDLN